MFCPNCGTQVPSNAKVCPSCGTPLSNRTTQDAAMASEGDEVTTDVAEASHPANESASNSGADDSSASHKPTQAQTNDPASGPEPEPEPQVPHKEYGGAARIIKIVIGVILLVVGISRCTGVAKRSNPTTSTVATSQSTRGSNSTSSSSGTNTGSNTSTSSGSNSTTTNSGNGHSIDTSGDVLSDPELRDAHGNITLYAFMELDGKQLASLCNMQKFEVTFTNGMLSFINQKSANGFSIANMDNALDYNTILGLKKGGEGTPSWYVYILTNYDSGKAAYEGVSHCTTECSATANGYYVAVCCDSSGRRYLATANKNEDGAYIVILYNPEALEKGKFDQMHNGKYGKDAESVFTAFTGKSTDTHE